jgi:linoleate 10R-lipoxygenase
VLQGEPGQSEKIAQHFYERIRNLIMSKSFTLCDKGVKMLDIVRDVLRYAPLHWAATEVVWVFNISYSDAAHRKGNRPA